MESFDYTMPEHLLPPDEAPENCPSCGAKFKGKFCHKCGEKRLSAKDFHVGKYLRLVFEHFAHFDSKIVRSFWLLISRPGFLSAEFVQGRRNLYVKPLQFFLVVNLAFFFLFNDNDLFAPRLKYIYESDFRDWTGQSVRALTDDYAAREQLTPQTALRDIDAKIATNTKGLLYLYIPTLALVFYGLFFRSNPYFLCHLIFATHWFTFLLIFVSVTGVLAVGLFRLHGIALLSLFLALLLPFLFLALRRFYGQNVWWTLLKTGVFMAAFVVVFFLYRDFILFMTFRLI